MPDEKMKVATLKFRDDTPNILKIKFRDDGVMPTLKNTDDGGG